MRRRRILLAGLMSAVVLAAGGVAVTAYADDNPAAGGEASGDTSPPGGAPAAPAANPPLVDPDGAGKQHVDGADRTISFTLDLPSGEFSAEMVDKMVAQAQAAGLNNWIKQTSGDLSPRLPFPEATEHTDFDGQMRRTATGIEVKLNRGEVFEDLNWWQNIVGIMAQATLLVLGAGACGAVAPEFAPVCAGIGSAVAEFGKCVIYQGFDGKLGSPEDWANTIVTSLGAGLLAGGLMAGPLKGFTESHLVPLFVKVADVIRAMATKLPLFLRSAASGLVGAADFITSMRPALELAVDRLLHSV